MVPFFQRRTPSLLDSPRTECESYRIDQSVHCQEQLLGARLLGPCPAPRGAALKVGTRMQRYFSTSGALPLIRRGRVGEWCPCVCSTPSLLWHAHALRESCRIETTWALYGWTCRLVVLNGGRVREERCGGWAPKGGPRMLRPCWGEGGDDWRVRAGPGCHFGWHGGAPWGVLWWPPLSQIKETLGSWIYKILYHWQPTDKTLTRTKYYEKQIHMWGFKYSQHFHNNLHPTLLYNCLLHLNRIVSNQFFQTLILPPLDHKLITNY